MNWIKKIAQVIGAFVYAVIVGIILAVVCNLLSIYAIERSGWWGFISYTILIPNVIMWIFSLLVGLLFIPSLYLSSGNIVAKIIGAIPLIYQAVKCVIFLWSLEDDYGVLQWCWGIELTISYIFLFFTLAFGVFQEKK